MISELFLYDRDFGLFKEILNQSSIIQGRYHISPNYGHELNTANLDQYIKDPASGMADIKQMYPCCVCVAPRSRIVNIEGGIQEEYTFNLFFLTETGRRDLDKDTNKSTRHVWYDWSEMNEVAINFLTVLSKMQRKKTEDGKYLGGYMIVDFSGGVVTRLSKYLNDKVSGVGLTFGVTLIKDICVIDDYPESVLYDIVIPDFNLNN